MKRLYFHKEKEESVICYGKWSTVWRPTHSPNSRKQLPTLLCSHHKPMKIQAAFVAVESRHQADRAASPSLGARARCRPATTHRPTPSPSPPAKQQQFPAAMAKPLPPTSTSDPVLPTTTTTSALKSSSRPVVAGHTLPPRLSVALPADHARRCLLPPGARHVWRGCAHHHRALHR